MIDDPRPGLDAPLRAHIEWVFRNLEEGVQCPCCEQKAKAYRRKITSPMARGLIRQYRQARQEYVHTASVMRPDTHEASQLAWWGLLAEEPRTRPDGGRAGWWRITDTGAAFARGEITVPKYVWVYDGVVIRIEPEVQVSIQDALGTKFHYAELMAGL